MARPGCPPEFRQRVVDLVEAGRRVSEAAAELGVSEQTIYVWRRQPRPDARGADGAPLSIDPRGLAVRQKSARIPFYNFERLSLIPRGNNDVPPHWKR